jgi:hypothetical protein
MLLGIDGRGLEARPENWAPIGASGATGATGYRAKRKEVACCETRLA